MRRRYVFAALAVLIVLIGADTIYWRIVTTELRDGLTSWAADRRTEGWQVDTGPVRIAGWPLAAQVDVPALKIVRTDRKLPGGVGLESDAVILSIPLFRPTTVDAVLQGRQRLRLGNGQNLDVTGEQLTVQTPLSPSGPAWADLHGSGLHFGPDNGLWHGAAALLDAHGELHVAEDGSSKDAAFTISAHSIDLPAILRWPLGSAVKTVSAAGTLNGPFPSSRPLTDWLTAWRDGGGSLEVTRLSVDWGPLGLSSTATLALDDQLQPMGSGSAKVSGYAEALDRLAAAGLLTKSAAMVAKAVLSLLAGSGDASSSVDVPLTLQYRTLSMRQVPLVRLPELDWTPQ